MKRYRSRVVLIVPVLLILLLAVPASERPGAQPAPLGPDLESSPDSMFGEYDSLVGTVLTGEIAVSGSRVDFGIGFSAGGSGLYNTRRLTGPGGATLDYQLRDEEIEGKIVKDLDGAADGSGLISGNIRGGGRNARTETVPFYLVSPAGRLTRAGTYTDLITITLYEGELGEDGLREQTALSLSLTVPPFVAVAVVDTGGVFDTAADNAHLDFGTLVQGVLREVDLLVQTNTDYAVSIESMNNGVMVMEPPVDGSVIPYSLLVDGAPRDLSSGATRVAENIGPTPLAGDRYGLTFQIGEIAHATSGTYEDNLTVIVTAR